jgi:hypothetical protein
MVVGKYEKARWTQHSPAFKKYVRKMIFKHRRIHVLHFAVRPSARGREHLAITHDVLLPDVEEVSQL